MATYWFCSANTPTSVTVTADFGYCTDYREYTDEYCHYQTWSRNISFTVSGAHPALTIRFRYWQEYYQNGSLVWEGWINATCPIPAGGAGTYYYEDIIGYAHDCKENRYCNFSEGLFPDGGVIQQAL
jgi:hypothetical protein